MPNAFPRFLMPVHTSPRPFLVSKVILNFSNISELLNKFFSFSSLSMLFLGFPLWSVLFVLRKYLYSFKTAQTSMCFVGSYIVAMETSQLLLWTSWNAWCTQEIVPNSGYLLWATVVHTSLYTIVSRHLQLTLVMKSIMKLMPFPQFIVLFVSLYIFFGLV